MICDPVNLPSTGARGVFDKLRGLAVRESKRTNLDRLWAVLEEIRGESSEFTLAEIGRRLEARGGPKTQSLRNDNGADFRELIEAYVDEMPKATRRAGVNSKVNPDRIEEALALVQDIGVRTGLLQVLAENKLLKHQNDQLRASFKGLSVSEKQFIPSTEPSCQVVTSGNPVLNEADLAALRRGMDSDRIIENGWMVQDDGSVVDDSGVVVLPPGFVHAVQKLLS